MIGYYEMHGRFEMVRLGSWLAFVPVDVGTEKQLIFCKQIIFTATWLVKSDHDSRQCYYESHIQLSLETAIAYQMDNSELWGLIGFMFFFSLALLGNFTLSGCFSSLIHRLWFDIQNSRSTFPINIYLRRINICQTNDGAIELHECWGQIESNLISSSRASHICYSFDWARNSAFQYGLAFYCQLHQTMLIISDEWRRSLIVYIIRAIRSNDSADLIISFPNGFHPINLSFFLQLGLKWQKVSVTNCHVTVQYTSFEVHQFLFRKKRNFQFQHKRAPSEIGK